MKKFLGLESKDQSKKKEPLIPTTSDVLKKEVMREIGVDDESINILDVLHKSVNKSRNKNVHVTTIFGTGQARRSIESDTDEHKGFNAKTYSGPINKSTHPSTKNSEIKGYFNSELYMSSSEFKRQAEQPLIDFVKSFVTKVDSSDTKHSSEPFKWLEMGHSRGGVIARLLANTKTKDLILSDGRRVVIECDAKDQNYRTIKLLNPKGEIIKKCPLQMYLLLFSATPGFGSKGNDGSRSDGEDFVHLGRNTTLVDFLAAQDTGIKGKTFKPLTHRRTQIADGSFLFLHMPVYHAAVTKGVADKTLHLEIELLISYLFMKYAGINVDVDALKIPSRIKTATSKETKMLDVDLGQGRGFLTSQNCRIADCIAAVNYKFRLMRIDSDYKVPALTMDLHEQHDRRFLVMRSGAYATVLQERLDLVQQALSDKKCEQPLTRLFEVDKSPETQAYSKFAQLCVNKNGINDPKLRDPDNLRQFLLLKSAAILHDKPFVKSLFAAIDKNFDDYSSISLKNDILIFLESQPVFVIDKALKQELQNVLPLLARKYKPKSKDFDFTEFLNPLVKLKRFVEGVQKNPENLSMVHIQEKLEIILQEFSEKRRDSYREKALSAIMDQAEAKQQGAHQPRIAEDYIKITQTKVPDTMYSLFAPKTDKESGTSEAPQHALVCLD